MSFHAVLIKNRCIPKSSINAFNIDFLLLKKICYALKIPHHLKYIARRYDFYFGLSDIFSCMDCNWILLPCSGQHHPARSYRPLYDPPGDGDKGRHGAGGWCGCGLRKQLPTTSPFFFRHPYIPGVWPSCKTSSWKGRAGNRIKRYRSLCRQLLRSGLPSQMFFLSS